MNYIDLFHGIGGFALGAYWARMEFENHLCSDIEPYAQKLYKLRFPESIQLGDIKKVDPEELRKKYGSKWIITGGFPCQPFSHSGKQLGEKDDRNMWPETIRIIRGLLPTWAIFENVNGSADYLNETVLPDLEREGYCIEPISIPAAAIGADHKRERWFLVAYSNSEWLESVDIQKPILFDQEKSCRWELTRTIDEALPADDYSRVRRNNDGVSEIMDRLKGLGNSIVPQIACLLFQQIKEIA